MFKLLQKLITEFIALESAGGILLVVMAVLALIIENSPLQSVYEVFLNTHISFSLGGLGFNKSILHWINDGLMVLFFFLVGMEIKRELLVGELSSKERALLPLIAAIGGMAIPAAIYIAFNWNHPESLNGWAIPAATDIAFALGMVALLGRRVPTSIKVFLTALAILDDVGAILIIAIFYTKNINFSALIFAAVCVALLFFLNWRGITKMYLYYFLGILLWIAVLKSGVHATVAGVVLALSIPLTDPNNPDYSPLRKIEDHILPWTAFVILPIFAFANAGISFSGLKISDLLHPIPLGIAFGLFFGKQIGVFLTSWIAVKLKLAKLPEGANGYHLYGVSILCGIGFTMSLFIGALAFYENQHFILFLKIGVFAGSIVSGVMGYLVLYLTSIRSKQNQLLDSSKRLG